MVDSSSRSALTTVSTRLPSSSDAAVSGNAGGSTGAESCCSGCVSSSRRDLGLGGDDRLAQSHEVNAEPAHHLAGEAFDVEHAEQHMVGVDLRIAVATCKPAGALERTLRAWRERQLLVVRGFHDLGDDFRHGEAGAGERRSGGAQRRRRVAVGVGEQSEQQVFGADPCMPELSASAVASDTTRRAPAEYPSSTLLTLGHPRERARRTRPALDPPHTLQYYASVLRVMKGGQTMRIDKDSGCRLGDAARAGDPRRGRELRVRAAQAGA